MTVQQGPARCEEYLPYSEPWHSFEVCHSPLPCSQQHASTREVALRFEQWGRSRGYVEAINDIAEFIEQGNEIWAIKQHLDSEYWRVITEMTE